MAAVGHRLFWQVHLPPGGGGLNNNRAGKGRGAEMAKSILAWSKTAGQFYREIGKRQNGKARRFYLGGDEKQATANVARLEGLWEGVETLWQDLSDENLSESPFPCWDDVTVALGQAISKGEWTITVEPPDDGPEEVAIWLGSFRSYFPMIQVQIEDSAKVSEGNQAMIRVGQQMVVSEEARHLKELREIKKIVAPYGGKVATKETLHDALDAYKTWIEQTFVNIEGTTTQSGKKQGERAKRIKQHATDMPLSDFGHDEIEAIIEFWRVRPKKEDGNPYSFTLCKHTIRLFKHFLRWLHKENSFPWKKPVDLDLDGTKIVPDKEVKYKIETYSKDEIAILWEHATFFERQLLLLALNCGFSISEIGSLDWKHMEEEGRYIKGLRPKANVYGEFRLWDMTRKALGDPKKTGLVLVTKDGTSLIAPTKGNNTSSKIPSAWYRLLNRIKKQHPEFKRLGFHHLRKTAGDLIRQVSDGETMGVFLRHGQPVKSDSLAGVYSNPVFPRVFDAQDKVWALLQDVFTPLEEVDRPWKYSPATIRKIRALKKQGVTTRKLAETYGMSHNQIRVYCRKSVNGKSDK